MPTIGARLALQNVIGEFSLGKYPGKKTEVDRGRRGGHPYCGVGFENVPFII